MIPRHCGDVGIAEVDFPLEEKRLIDHFLHRKSYTRTKFYAVTNKKDWAVVQIFKKQTKNLFQKVEEVKVLSLPDRTRFIIESNLDVLQIGHLLAVQAEHPKDLIIVQGRFDHVSFIDVRLPAKIRVVDVVPPNPSKLQSIIKDFLGTSSNIIKIDLQLINIERLAEEIVGDKLILPCGSAYDDLVKTTKKELLFLDRAPDLSKKDIMSAEVIGCSLSKRIFEELYGSAPNLHNMCPKESEFVTNNEIPTISRCCKVKNGVEIDGNWVSVPWGADLCEVGEAIRIVLSMNQGEY
ncbi:MAG: hypothetical protein OEV21_05245 [Thermoplasmata archaeon]|nr:hypothetical protein [Thermoplasmata archaeon]